MKNLKLVMGVLVYSLIISEAVYSQTNVIAVKSQAGEMADVLERTDNFGEINPRYLNMQVDSVQFFSEQKMYVKYSKGATDTVSFSNLPDSLINKYVKYIGFDYPETTKFIGFPEGVYEGACEEQRVKKNSLSTWGILITLLFAGGIMARQKSKA